MGRYFGIDGYGQIWIWIDIFTTQIFSIYLQRILLCSPEFFRPKMCPDVAPAEIVLLSVKTQ